MFEGLTLRDVHLAFAGKPVLRGLNLTLKGAGCTVVLGPNGVGKSLFLRLIHGLIAPDRGEIRWGDQMPEAARQSQAMMFQSPVLLRRSVADNLRFVLRARGLPEGDAENLLEQVGLADKAEHPARRLSGGEAQRLALARALAVRPKVLLLDEPTSSLDPGSSIAIERIIEQAQGIKVICVTHDIGQARRLAEDIVFLDQGQVRVHQSAEAFFDGQSDTRIADFLAGRLLFDGEVAS